jgi:hypothetical protein
VILLAVGACGDAADAIYHQLAYEMVRAGVNQAAMLPVMQRMQTADLMYLLPLIAAFLVGCVVLAVAAAQLGIVSKWNPMLYVLFVIVAIGVNGLDSGFGVVVSGRAIGLTCLGLLSFSLAWLGLAIRRLSSISYAVWEYEYNPKVAKKIQKLARRYSRTRASTLSLSAGSGKRRATDTAPAIALKMTKKLRSRSCAVTPGMKAAHRSVSSFMSPANRFLTAGFVRTISGAQVTTGQPVAE